MNNGLVDRVGGDARGAQLQTSTPRYRRMIYWANQHTAMVAGCGGGSPFDRRRDHDVHRAVSAGGTMNESSPAQRLPHGWGVVINSPAIATKPHSSIALRDPVGARSAGALPYQPPGVSATSKRSDGISFDVRYGEIYNLAGNPVLARRHFSGHRRLPSSRRWKLSAARGIVLPGHGTASCAACRVARPAGGILLTSCKA